MADLAELAAEKGFAFDDERAFAAQTFGALALANVPIPPDEVYVWGATHGFRRDDATKLEEYSERLPHGGTVRAYGRTVRVDQERAERMIEDWRARAKED